MVLWGSIEAEDAVKRVKALEIVGVKGEKLKIELLKYLCCLLNVLEWALEGNQRHYQRRNEGLKEREACADDQRKGDFDRQGLSG